MNRINQNVVEVNEKDRRETYTGCTYQEKEKNPNCYEGHFCPGSNYEDCAIVQWAQENKK